MRVQIMIIEEALSCLCGFFVDSKKISFKWKKSIPLNLRKANGKDIALSKIYIGVASNYS